MQRVASAGVRWHLSVRRPECVKLVVKCEGNMNSTECSWIEMVTAPMDGLEKGIQYWSQIHEQMREQHQGRGLPLPPKLVQSIM
eukprot:43742-Chlamydomonas_euryale.AAC.1